MMDRFFFIASTFLLLIFLISCEQKENIQSGETQISDSLAGAETNIVIPSNAPSWYMTDYNDANFLYGKGTARSRRVTIARDKAIMKAQVELAREFKLNSADELKGSLIKEQKQIREGDLWRIFVLLEAPVDSNKTSGMY